MGIKTFIAIAAASLLFLTLLIIPVLSQNLGESSGSLVFNVSLGGTQSRNYTIFDGGSAPISFMVTPPQFNPISNNTNPIVTISQLSGVLQPGQQVVLGVMVRMPSTNKPGVKWDGIMQVLAINNASNPGGAVIQGGLGKEVIIYSSLPPKNTLGQLLYVIIGAVAAVVIVASVVLVLKGRKGAGKKKPQKYKYVLVKKKVRVK